MRHFAVAAGHDLTADAAAETLGAGGSAVDAVVAGAMAAMVAEPVLAGLLGGGFLTVRMPDGRARVLDFFVQTPLREIPAEDLDLQTIHADFGTTTQEFHVGAGTIATPGVARGLAEAHDRLGRVPFRELVAHARDAGRNGLALTPFQAQLLEVVRPIYTATPGARQLFAPEETLLTDGAVFRNPSLADVLEEYAQEGPRFVTEGEVAQRLLALTDQGGHLTADDLRKHEPKWRSLLRVPRGAATVSLNPPPSLGGTLIAFGLHLLPRDPSSVTLVHGLAATAKARLEAMLDSDTVDGAERLLNPELVETFRKYLHQKVSATLGTTHISAVDAQGMGAALTLSNGTGAGMVVPGTGIMPNNMLGEADLLPNGLHGWPTGERLASMMAPMVVDWPDGRFAMLGSGGSNRIRTALLQVVLNLVDRGMSLHDAVEAPRLHAEGHPETRVDFEDVAGERFRDEVLSAAPDATAWPDRSMFFGGAHAVLREARGGMLAAGDPRRSGVARVG